MTHSPNCVGQAIGGRDDGTITILFHRPQMLAGPSTSHDRYSADIIHHDIWVPSASIPLQAYIACALVLVNTSSPRRARKHRMSPGSLTTCLATGGTATPATD